MTCEVRRMAQWGSLALAAVLAACATIDRGHDPKSVTQTELQRAQDTLAQFREDPNMAGFRDRLKDAKGVIIAPRVGRGGFIFGGSGAEAIALVREPNGEWSQPAFYKIASASAGLQIGADVSEVVMLLMTDRAVNGLVAPKFDLGADASVAAGPMSIGAQRDLSADVLSYAKSRGAYAGLTVGGAYIQPDEAANEAFYGKRVTPTDILVRRNVSNPQSAELQRSLSGLQG